MSELSHTCLLCGRRGTRGFMPSISTMAGSKAHQPGVVDWICRSTKACDRRARATGEVGIGTMRNYVR